jgi:ATP-dependent RNA helicase DeaD
MIAPQNQRGRLNRLLRGAGIQAEWCDAPSLDDVKSRDRERLLQDESLTRDYDDDALSDARELLALHSPEKIAAAFLFRMQASIPSPEDIVPVPAGREKSPRREPFSGGVWFKLTAGHKQRAEPRWLLPMICRMGDVTRTEVGAIEIGETETHFEIAGEHAERFAEHVKASGGREGTIYIHPAEAPAGKTGRTPRDDRPRRKFEPKPDRRPERPANESGAKRKPRYTPDDGAPRRAEAQTESGTKGESGRQPRDGQRSFHKDPGRAKRGFSEKTRHGSSDEYKSGSRRSASAKTDDPASGKAKFKRKPKPRRANYHDGEQPLKRVKRKRPQARRS